VTLQETLNNILVRLPTDRQRQVVEFAQFLAWQDEQAAWQRFGQTQLAQTYGDDEPDYTTADLKGTNGAEDQP
jgi:hypothetical protein